MFIKRAIAALTLTATMAAAIPAAPALADGRASTRNIIFGLGAATYLIIQHNRKVHERYAEDARRQASLESENNQAWAAYSSEKNAYDNALAEIVDLKREVAYQHDIIVQQRQQLSMAQRDGYHVQAAYIPPRRVSKAHRNAAARRVAHHARAPQQRSSSVAMVSYGWGDI